MITHVHLDALDNIRSVNAGMGSALVRYGLAREERALDATCGPSFVLTSKGRRVLNDAKVLARWRAGSLILDNAQLADYVRRGYIKKSPFVDTTPYVLTEMGKTMLNIS